MSKELLAIGLTALIHVVAGGLLVWHLMRSHARSAGDGDDGGWRGWWPQDPEPVPPPGGGQGRGWEPPAGDAVPGPVRLRGPEPLGVGADPRERRPAHPVPAREPAPDREPVAQS